MADINISDVMQTMENYGAAYSRTMAQFAEYDETQCSACPYQHRCCELAVAVSPFEAAAIVGWIMHRMPRPHDLLRKVEKRAKRMFDFFNRFPDQDRAIDAWAAKHEKCVFYAPGRGCMIYPVRPAACRRVWSRADCNKDPGPFNVPQEAATVRDHRLDMVRVPGRDDMQHAELCSAVTIIARGEPISTRPWLIDILRHHGHGLDDRTLLRGPHTPDQEPGHGSPERPHH